MLMMITKATIYRWCIVAILLTFTIIYVDWADVLYQLDYKHFIAFIVVQPIQFILIFFLSIRFSCLIVNKKLDYTSPFQAYLLSVGLNSFLPGRISEFIKITYLKEWADIPVSSSSVALLIERGIDAVFLASFLLLGLGTLWIDINEVYIVAAMLVGGALMYFLSKYESFSIRTVSFIANDKVRIFIEKVIHSLCITIRSKGFLWAFIISALTWVGSYVFVYVSLLIMLGDSINASSALIVFSAMAIGRAIPGLPGGVGTYEAAIIIAMEYLGFSFSESLVTALTLHCSQLLLVTMVSLFVMGKKGIGVMSLFKRYRGVDGHL